MALSDVFNINNWSPANLLKQVQAGYQMITNPPKASTTLTPYAQGRINGSIAAPTPTKAPAPTSTTISNVAKMGTSSIPNYSTAFNQGQSAAQAAYQPYTDYLKGQVKDTTGRYNAVADSAKSQIPLIQQRYSALLDQLNQVTETNKNEINSQEANQIGQQDARAAARGTFGSSGMEGGEQMITKYALQAISDLLSGQKSKQQELSASEGTDIGNVEDYMNNLKLQGANAAQGLLGNIAQIPSQLFSAAGNYATGVTNTAAAQENSALQQMLASIKGGGSAGGTYQDYVDQNGQAQTGYFVNGQLVNNIGSPISKSGAGQNQAGLSAALAKVQADNVVTPEEYQWLKQQFPYDSDTIDNLVTVQQPNIWDNIKNMFSGAY
jgi:hypothetical protein